MLGPTRSPVGRQKLIASLTPEADIHAREINFKKNFISTSFVMLIRLCCSLRICKCICVCKLSYNTHIYIYIYTVYLYILIQCDSVCAASTHDKFKHLSSVASPSHWYHERRGLDFSMHFNPFAPPAMPASVRHGAKESQSMSKQWFTVISSPLSKGLL